MSYTFADLKTNIEIQNIVLNRVPYGKQCICEPFETLFRWVNRDRIEGFSYEAPLKDNSRAIDCVIGNMAIQLKNTKAVNKDKELAYMREVLKQEKRENLRPVLIQCTDDLYSRLLSQCDFNTPSVELRPYQKEFIDKHLDGICSHHISIVNCFCRFGKSYLMRYIADMFRWEVSVITTKPTETREDYKFNDVVSIQYLKLHHSERGSSERAPDTPLHDIVFIDEPQESFMTDLTEATLDLDNFKHVVFFTGTSEKLEWYLKMNTYEYYLAHYNFGDYISHPVEGFPKIHFHLGESSEPEHGIRLIFNRKGNRKQCREEAAAKGWKFQSAVDETDIKLDSAEGTYLLIVQYTTGATIPNCFVVEDRNESFTEQDIQLIFRCFNQKDVNIERHVYFKNLTVYKQVLMYLYRQTDRVFLNGEIAKEFFAGIVNPEDIDKCEFGRMAVEMTKTKAKDIMNRLIEYHKSHNKGERRAREMKKMERLRKEVERKENAVHTKKTLEEMQNALQGQASPAWLTLMGRMLSALVMAAYKEGIMNEAVNHVNKYNHDMDCEWMYGAVKDKAKVYEQYLSFKFSADDYATKEDVEFVDDLCQIIIEGCYDGVKNKFLSYVYEMIRTPLSKAKYEEMKELFMTTDIEKKQNAEVLTPWEVAEEMVNACEQCGVLKPGVKCLEPCCGKGVFVAILLLREYEVDYSDVSPANVQFCDILTGREGKVADALTLDYTPYDLVITNPPYNEPKCDTQNRQPPIYQRFVKAAFQAKASCLLIKGSFATAVSPKGITMVRDQLIKHLQYKRFYPKDIFKSVNIAGGVMFYIYNQTFDAPTQSSQFILREEVNTFEESVLDQFEWMSRAQKIETNDSRLVDKPTEGYIPCHVPPKKGGIKYFPRNRATYPTDCYYLIFPYVGGEKVFSDFKIVKPGECFSRSFFGFKVKDEDEAKRLEAHLKKYTTEIAKLKLTQGIQRDYFKVVPRMDM